MKILIAEDETISKRILRTALEKAGHQVVEAGNGAQAWQLFDRAPARIIVSDWMMPELDGLGLCKKVRGRPRTEYTYFILLTARVGKHNYHEAMDTGVDDFLAKPLDREELGIRLRVAERILGFTTKIRQLETLLPICAYCKKIRDENQRWHRVEEYISKRTETSFSHGICPDCYEVHVKPILAQSKKQRSSGV